MQSAVGVKVGASSNPSRRRRQLQTQYGIALTISYCADVDPKVARAVEYEAHGFLTDYHQFGEWFSCSTDIAIAAVIRAIAGEKATKYPTMTSSERTVTAFMLLRLIHDHQGRIATTEARKILRGRVFGRAAKQLRGQGLIESWTDVLVLTDRGRSLIPQVATTSPAFGAVTAGGQLPLPVPPESGRET
jgi:hypothetical protein